MVSNTAPPAPPTPSVDERVRQVGVLSKLLTRPELGAVAGTVLVWVFFAVIAHGNNFVSWLTLASILNRAAPLGILAVAVALLMIGGEFDLSVGSLIGFSGMTIMVLVFPTDGGGFGWSLWPAMVLALLIAVASGIFNGTLVMTTKLPSFIITLATLFIFRGLTIALTRYFTDRTQLGHLDTVSGYGLANTLFSQKITILGASYSVSILWWIALTVLATWVLLRTRSGNWIFGSGGDADAARNQGVPVSRTKIALFVATAMAAWLVAVIQVVEFKSADTLRGTLQEFYAIIAVVIGGTLLTGGYGSAVGAFLGALIFAMVQQGIVITGVNGDWFRVFVGVVLVVAVVFNQYVRQQAAKR